MGWYLETVLAYVRGQDSRGVDAQISKGVDRDQYVSDICLLNSFVSDYGCKYIRATTCKLT
jgi:hypothetical protein